MYELRARSMCQPTEVYIFLSCRGVQRMLLLLQRFPSVLHQQADGCRSCVELGHFVLLNDLPEPADMRVNRNTFELEKTHTLLKGALEGGPACDLSDLRGHLWRRLQAGRMWCRSGRWSSRCRRCTSTRRHGDGRKRTWRSATYRVDTRQQCAGHPVQNTSSETWERKLMAQHKARRKQT